MSLNFKQFISWIMVFVLAWTIGYIHNVHFNLETAWINSIYDQKIALLRASETSPRLIVLGGSGTHMGVDTTLIEQKLDIGVPVYNIGLHGGIGLNAILASIRKEIRPGDIVLLIPEYGVLATKDGIRTLTSDFAFASDILDVTEFNWQQKSQLSLRVGQPGLRGLVGSLTYWLRHKKIIFHYTDQMDLRGNPPELKVRATQAMVINSLISEDSRAQIKAFRHELEAQGSHLILALPWTFYPGDQQSIQNVQTVAKELSQIAPLIHDQDLNLKTDPSLFGDSVNHLSDKGREIRSLAMAEQLRPLVVDLVR